MFKAVYPANSTVVIGWGGEEMKTLLFALALCWGVCGANQATIELYGSPTLPRKTSCTCLVPSPHVFESHKDMKERDKRR